MRVQPERDHDEDHLDTLEEHALEGDDEREPVESLRVSLPASLPASDLSAKSASSSCMAFRPDDLRTPSQPLEAEDQSSVADPELKGGLGNQLTARSRPPR